MYSMHHEPVKFFKEMWAGIDATPRVDAFRLKRKSKPAPKAHVNHQARYRKLRRAAA